MGRMSTPSPSDIPGLSSLTVPAKALPRSSAEGGVARPVPLSLTSSARRITSKTIKRVGGSQTASSAASWQEDGWSMYDLVGEQRFLANVLAGRGARAHLFVGTLSHDDPLADPEPTEDDTLQSILDAFGKNSVGRSQIILRQLINQFVAGEGYFVGIPPKLMPDYEAPADESIFDGNRLVIRDPSASLEARSAVDEVSLEDLQWHMMSTYEVKRLDDKRVSLTFPSGDKIEVAVDDVYLIQAWRPHPARGWEPDSPTRSSLPVLRELVGLTMAISGQVDSRLAGAGILAIAQQVSDAARRVAQEAAAAGGTELDPEADPLLDSLIEAMSKAIEDRASASSFTPIGVVIPDGLKPSEAFHHYTFSTPLDKEYAKLRDEAIRRLALGQDAPPELLLGVGGMNHWGAWLVREDVVTTHIEPPLALLCDALTTQYLRPAMRATGVYTDQEIDDTVIWYDVSHLVTNPNRGSDATELYDRGELSGEALRAARGFDENDAPATIGVQNDPAVDLALQLIAQAPSLMQTPGLPAVVEQIRAVQRGEAATAEAAEEEQEGGSGNAPDRAADDDTGDTEGGPPAGGPEFSIDALGVLEVSR